MIFRKLLKLWWSYSPGSVGSIARTMAKTYTNLQRKFPNKSKRNLIILTLESRYPFKNKTTNIVGQSLPAPIEFIVDEYGGNLHNAIMIVLSVEHPEIEEVPASTILEINAIIDEIVQKYAPSNIDSNPVGSANI